MRLSELNIFNSIIIQCHDNPDADAIGSAYALYRYFLEKGKSAKIVYGGNFFISKCNLELMITELEIPITHIDNLDNTNAQDTVLITVDCQYGAGNVTRFNTENVAVIDHHADVIDEYKLSEIRSNLGACSTLVWNMLCREEFDVNKDKKIATALYYGLFMDTGGFAEIVHPLDRDLMDNVQPDKRIINRLKNTNLSLQELETTGIALIRHLCDRKNKFALVKTHPCDPNILGIISDLLLQVNDIELCVVYNELPFGCKLSVRSCRVDVNANEFADYITKGVGNGGGHRDKAGGFISKDKFENKYGNTGMDEYFLDMQRKYFNSFEIVNVDDYKPNYNEFCKYVKKEVELGYVVSSDILKEGTMMLLRTMEGDVNIISSDEIYIMIDIDKNVYPIDKKIFQKRYISTDEKFQTKYEYAPKVKDVIQGNIIEIPDYVRKCYTKTDVKIYGKKISTPVKVFTKWDYESYMYGKSGDYLVFAENSPEDLYVVKGEIMDRTYTKIENS